MTHITFDKGSHGLATTATRFLAAFAGVVQSWKTGTAAARRYQDLSMLGAQELEQAKLTKGDLAREAMFPTRTIPGVR